MSIALAVAGVSYSLKYGSLKIEDSINMRSLCDFTIEDVPGTTRLVHGMPVTVTDSINGLLFAGFVDQPDEHNLYPNAQNEIDVTCMDMHYLADKRRPTSDYTGMTAGDIVTDMLSQYLAAEGVTAGYAYRRDNNAATFGAGVLSSTSATSGDLELTSAGTTFTKTESSTADFNTGTNVLTVGNNNSLQLVSSSSLRLTGSCSAALGSNLYTYVAFWQGSRAVASGDYLQYSIWISSTSPACTGGVDMLTTDNVSLRDSAALDQHQMSPHPKTSLQGYASDQWYTRKITVPASMVGKTIGTVTIAQEGDLEGTYTLYVRNCQYFNSGGTLLQNFYTGGLPSSNRQMNNAGYYNVSAVPATTYETTGTRTSPAYSLAAPYLLKDSLLSWQQSVPVQPASNATQGTAVAPVAVNVSWDGGAVWLPATNHAPIPGMLPGMNLTGISLQVQQILSVAGPSPELTPSLSACVMSVQPSYNVIKSDVLQATAAGGFGTGTITNLTAIAGGIQLAALIRNWNDGNIASQTLYGSDLVSPPAQSESFGTLGIRVQGTNSDGRARMDWAGNFWVDFVAEFDLQMPNNTAAQYGLEYHTQNWQNGLNTGGYRMDISYTTVQFNRGTNNASGAGTNTLISTTGTPWFPVVGNWYHCKVVVAGNTHTLYIDNVLFISATDTTWPGAGYVALRYLNNAGAGVRTTTFFDNFGIQGAAFTGSRVHPSVSISACGVVQNSYIAWNANVPSNTILLVEASVDGGSTWQTCLNGFGVPGATSGVNVAGKSLLLRETLTTNNANATPLLQGITALVVGGYNAIGTRYSPTTYLTNVGRAGSASVSWTANVPTGTTLGVDVTPDGSTWTDITALNGLPLPSAILYAQPDPYLDFFATNSSASYTATFRTGGAVATWTWDTANKRLVQTGGNDGLLLYTALVRADMWVEAAYNYAGLDYTNTGPGLVCRAVNTSNFYFLNIVDSGDGNSILLYKCVANVFTLLGSYGGIGFTRGDYHVFRLSTIGTTISVLMDGATLLTRTDSGVTAAGKAGLFGGARSQVYTLRVQALGDDVTAKSLATRLRLASTNPLVTPQVTNLSLSVHSPAIGIGALIATTAYAYAKTCAQSFDDLVTQSTNPNPYLWYIGNKAADLKQLNFRQNRASAAPFYIFPNKSLLWTKSPIVVSRPDMLYRNRMTVDGGVDTTLSTPPETHMGDGFSQSWTMTYPVNSLTSVTLDGVLQNLGVQGAVTGKDFYYTVGSNVITQDSSETPPGPLATLVFTYVPQIPVRVTLDNVDGSLYPGTVGQTQLAVIDGTSGIVHAYISVPGINKADATAMCQGLLQKYGVLGRSIVFAVKKWGLQPGQLVPITLPAHGIANAPFLITKVTTTTDLSVVGADPDLVGNLLYTFLISATEGPIEGDFTTFFSTLIAGLS